MNLPKTSSRRKLWIGIFAGCILSLTLVFYISPHLTQSDIKAPALPTPPHKVEGVKQAEASAGLPVRLKIPKLNVDAAVGQMGLTPEGDMQSPSGSRDVGWYKFGSRPGNKGSAVIAGHYGRWENGEGSVFDHLHTLDTGDNLYVEDAAGKSTAFVVRESRRYDPEADASEVFSSHDGKAHLNLITCEGIWKETQQTYSNRLVLFADKK